MTRRIQRFAALLSVVLLGSIALAQEPVVDIDKGRHPNLAEAQRLVAEANGYIYEAQEDNRYDMKGHAVTRVCTLPVPLLREERRNEFEPTSLEDDVRLPTRLNPSGIVWFYFPMGDTAAGRL